MRGCIFALVLGLIAVSSGSAGAWATGPTTAYEGRPLAEVLRELRDAGLDLIFSSAVVPESLLITVEPDRSRDDVGTLLRLAGKRKPVPQERLDRVRSAAHEQWKQETGSRSRRRTIWAVAGLLVAASLITVMVLNFLPDGGGATSVLEASIRVEALSGTVEVRDTTAGSGTTSRNVSIGDAIAIGTEFTTLDEGRVALRLSSGYSMRLDAATRIQCLAHDSFVLDRGAVYVDSGIDEGRRRNVKIDTPFGAVHEIGTQFEVRLDDVSIRVRLREGSVVVERDEDSQEIEAGTELKITADGAVTRRSIQADGAEWDWAVAIAPMPDLEGRPARTFLEWVARERGWKLTFADETLARSAEQILLDGSFSQLSTEQALDAILPACRMTYRVEQGTLVVSADSGKPATH